MNRFESRGFDGQVVSARWECGDAVKSLLVRYVRRVAPVSCTLNVDRCVRDTEGRRGPDTSPEIAAVWARRESRGKESEDGESDSR